MTRERRVEKRGEEWKDSYLEEDERELVATSCCRRREGVRLQYIISSIPQRTQRKRRRKRNTKIYIMLII